MNNADSVHCRPGVHSISSVIDHQEVVFLVNQLIEKFEERTCWESCDVVIVTVDFGDKHASKTLCSKASCAVDAFPIINICC